MIIKMALIFAIFIEEGGPGASSPGNFQGRGNLNV